MGNFTLTQTITYGTDPRAIITGDWDGDGDIDIAITNSSPSTITILKNLNNGNFSQTNSFVFLEDINSFTSGDFDNDGKLDIAIGISGGLKIMKNDGGANFTIILVLSSTLVQSAKSSNDLSRFLIAPKVV